MTKGYSHIGVATHDMDATIKFYTAILGFTLAADHLTRIKEGGWIRQVYFGIGADEFLVFMEAKGVQNISETFATGINQALGTPAGMYHLSFRVDSLNDLEKRKAGLNEAGVQVSDVIDLGHAKSIFLFDPNDLQLEFCCHMRAFTDEDMSKVSDASLA